MSQFQCGCSSSQTSYPSKAWWAITPPTTMMGRRLIPKREVLRSSALTSAPFEAVVSCCISSPFGGLSTTRGKITYVLLTRAPLNWSCPQSRSTCMC